MAKILAVVLYECRAWPLTLMDRHQLRVFEVRVLSRMFEPKRTEVQLQEKVMS